MDMAQQIAELKVLIVDDCYSQRLYLKEICKISGLKNIYEADNGITALMEITLQPIDIVFVDLEMPQMDGIELLRKIAQVCNTQAIIILSSKDPTLIYSVGTMAESDGLKVLGTYQKPIEVDKVYKSIDSYFNYKTALESPQKNNNLLKTDLNDAIIKKEFYLAYQPKVSMDGKHLKSVEALARWEHHTKGKISPIEFISIAEKYSLILPLTLLLFELALKDKQVWQKEGISLQLAFNLSPLSLADKSIVKNIEDLMAKYNILPTEIIFEVTENALHKDTSDAIETLAILRMKNFNISIDDYGTGFANAQQLSRVPANELKIDRTLIHNVSNKPQQQTILKSTATLAKELSLQTVAEGVENRSDLDYIRSLDIDLIQGYIFAKPMKNQDLLLWIKKELSELTNKFK